jgi:hypothetical protein
VEAREYLGPGQQNVPVSSLINRSAMRGCGTHLVYHIDKRLCVFLNEGMDCVTRIVARENGFDKGGQLILSECACDQTSTGCEAKVREKDQGQSAFHARRQKWG